MSVIPVGDGVPTRRFPIVTVSLIAANFAVWLFYELPHLDSSIYHASFYPCTVNGSCHGPEPWGISWVTAMFLHGSWAHILGNMLFLAIFGKNVEDAFGRLGYLVFYFAGGLVAIATQTTMTLIAGTAADARVPTLGASGAIAAVLGAYLILYPGSRVLSLIGIIPIWIPAWVFLGLWFLYQLVAGGFGLYSTRADGGGVAFFAHVGGFLFGVLATLALTASGRVSANGGILCRHDPPDVPVRLGCGAAPECDCGVGGSDAARPLCDESLAPGARHRCVRVRGTRRAHHRGAPSRASARRRERHGDLHPLREGAACAARARRTLHPRRCRRARPAR